MFWSVDVGLREVQERGDTSVPTYLDGSHKPVHPDDVYSNTSLIGEINSLICPVNSLFRITR